MQKGLLFAGISIIMLLGILIGRITAPKQELTATDDTNDSRTIHRGQQLSNREYRDSPSHPSNLQKPGGIKAGIAYILDENDPIQKNLKVHQLLESITRENWQELVDGMILSNGETGRNADYQLRSILVRIGQVDGQFALENGVGIDSGDDPRNHLLYGWAMIDPVGAWKWAQSFNENHPDRPIEIYGSAFGGMARTHPEAATRILNEMPDEEWQKAIGGYIRNIIRSETLDRTDFWLKDVMTSDRPDFLKQEAIKIVSRTVSSAARNLRPPEKIAEWYDQFGQHADDENLSMASKLVGSSGARDGANAAQLIDQLQQRGLVFGDNQLNQIQATMSPERRAEASKWLRQNNQADLATWFTE